MMKKLHILLFLVTHQICIAQKGCVLVYGDFVELLSKTTISVTVDFDSLMVVGYGTEREFIDKMKLKFEKKKTGEGDKWERSWNEKKTAVFERRFLSLFYKYSELEASASSEYRIIVIPTKLIPGFDNQDGTYYAYLSGKAWLIKTSQPNKKLGKIEFYNIRGEGIVADNTGSLRIGDAYAIAGRKMGKFVRKLIN